MNSNLDQLKHMAELLAEAINAAEQLQFNLKVATGDALRGDLSEDFAEDIRFDLNRLRTFARATEEAWGYCEF